MPISGDCPIVRHNISNNFSSDTSSPELPPNIISSVIGDPLGLLIIEDTDDFTFSSKSGPTCNRSAVKVFIGPNVVGEGASIIFLASDNIALDESVDRSEGIVSDNETLLSVSGPDDKKLFCHKIHCTPKSGFQ